MNARLINVGTTFRPTVIVNSDNVDGIAAFQDVINKLGKNGKSYSTNDVMIHMARLGWAFISMLDGTFKIVHS